VQESSSIQASGLVNSEQEHGHGDEKFPGTKKCYRGGGDIHQDILGQERKKEEQGTLSPRVGCWFELHVLLQAPSSTRIHFHDI
jgi:hypothetical protein